MSKKLYIEPEDVAGTDALDVKIASEEDAVAPAPNLDPKHLGHGVHARSSSSSAGVHVEDSALPSASHTGAGLGGMQIGDRRF